MKKVMYLVFVYVFINMVGCATILKQKSTDVVVNTEPGGANIFLNGDRVGKTPLTLNLLHKNPVVFTFKKEGYEEISRRIDNHIVGGWMIASLIGFYPGCIVDLATKSAYSLNENKVMITLVPIETNLSGNKAKEEK